MRLLLALGVVALAGLWAITLRPDFLDGPAGYIIVSGKSMEPTFYTGDLVVTKAQGSYEVGDVVAFRAEGGNVIHRIIGGDGVSGFDMQGDNNDWVDAWKPRTEDIIGKRWLHLEGAGDRLQDLRRPHMFAALVAGMASFSLISFKQVKRRRRGGGEMGHQTHDGGGSGGSGSGNGPLAAPSWAIGGLALTLMALVVFGFLLISALRTPETKTVLVDEASYEHSASFDYTVLTEPSTLYPAGVVGPVTAPVPGTAPDTEVAPPPVYTKGARQMDVGVTYALTSPSKADVAGQMSAELLVKATGEGGWTVRQELLPATPFTGPSAHARLTLDFAAIGALIARIEEETAFKPGNYELLVQPTVTLAGSVNGEPIEEAFSPVFTLKYTETTITADSVLRATDARSITASVLESRTVGLLAIPEARLAYGALTLLALGGAAVFACVVFLGWWQDETTQVRTRYGTRLVPVTEVEHMSPNRVQVGKLQDLAVLAQRDGKIIFSRTTSAGETFFVPDGSVTYEYTRPVRSKGA